MDGSITIGIISINELDDLKLIRVGNILINLFKKYYPYTLTQAKYKKLNNIFLYRYEADIIINFNKKYIDDNNYFDIIHRIFIEYSNTIKNNFNFDVLFINQK